VRRSSEEDGGVSATDLLQSGCLKEEQGSFRDESLCTHRVVVVVVFFFSSQCFLVLKREAHQGGWVSVLLTSLNAPATCLLSRAYLLPIGVYV